MKHQVAVEALIALSDMSRIAVLVCIAIIVLAAVLDPSGDDDA
jgi:hypothetical protein